tara:strand:+ start:2535 stop:3251 length:717 start_codon:yes stop_codon:yes gene_type:complete
MTRDQMQSEFKFLMDKIDSSNNPLFLPQEIDKLLNISQDKFVTKRAFGNNVRRTVFEEDQKRRDDLRTLISSTTINNQGIAGSFPNSVLLSLPGSSAASGEYRHSIMEEASIFDSGIPTASFTIDDLKRVSVKPITYDRYNKIMDDPFNKPEKHTVYRLDSSNNDYAKNVTLIYSEGMTLSSYFLHYIREPLVIGIDQDCILPNHTHREIVRMAVVEALEGIESPRYQTSKIELNEIE